MVIVRRAVAEDLPRILALANWAAAETTANFATEPESIEEWRESWARTQATHPWLVAVDRAAARDTIVGFAKASPHRARGAYAWTAEVTVYIDPAFHRRGVGRALYGALLPTLRAQGFASLLAGIVAGHEASEQLHATFGFVRCATFHRVGYKLGAWLDVGWWELVLLQSDAAPPSRKLVADVWRDPAAG